MNGRRSAPALAVIWLAFGVIFLVQCRSTDSDAAGISAVPVSSAVAEAAPVVAEPSAGSGLAATPTLRLLVATDLDGVLEPCGCTRDQLGGIDRLAAAIAEERKDGVPSLLLTAGDVFFANDAHATEPLEQDLWRAQTLAEILRGLRLDAAGMGPHDLARGHALLASLANQARFSWLGSGLLLERSQGQGLSTADAIATAALEPIQASALRTVGRLRVGIVGLLARPKPNWPHGVRGPDDPLGATLNELRKLREQHADLVVALADASASELAAFAERGAPDFIVASGAGLAPGATALGAAWALTARRASQALLVVDVWVAAPGAPFRQANSGSIDANTFTSRERTLPSTAPRDQAARASLDQLTKRVSAYNQQAYRDVAPAPVARDQAGYVGSRPCAACHTAEYLWWTQSPHARAYATLTQRDKQFDVECVSCHVTGYGKRGGSTLTHVDPLQNVGCESCHGPGSTHILDARPPQRFVRRVVPEKVCVPCHDAEHSAGFDYEQYRAALIARGHGLPLGQ